MSHEGVSVRGQRGTERERRSMKRVDEPAITPTREARRDTGAIDNAKDGEHGQLGRKLESVESF